LICNSSTSSTVTSVFWNLTTLSKMHYSDKKKVQQKTLCSKRCQYNILTDRSADIKLSQLVISLSPSELQLMQCFLHFTRITNRPSNIPSMVTFITYDWFLFHNHLFVLPQCHDLHSMPNQHNQDQTFGFIWTWKRPAKVSVAWTQAQK
jgi:hypothetical protein